MQHDNSAEQPSNSPKSKLSIKAKLFCLEKAVNTSNVLGYQFLKDYFEFKKALTSVNQETADVNGKIIELNESIKNSKISEQQKSELYSEISKITSAPESLLNPNTKELDKLILSVSENHSPGYEANIAILERAFFYLQKFRESGFSQNRSNTTYFDKIQNAEKKLKDSGDINQALLILLENEDKKDLRSTSGLPRLSFFSHLNKSQEQIVFAATKEMITDTAKEFNNKNKMFAVERRISLKR